MILIETAIQRLPAEDRCLLLVTHMKLKIGKSSAGKLPKQRERVSAFTWVEWVVVIAFMAILAAVVAPAVTRARNKAQMFGTMNNARQLYLAQFQMSNDGAASGDSTLAWPADMTGFGGGGNQPPQTLQDYVNVLVSKGYLKAGDLQKLLNAPGAPCTVTVGAGGAVTLGGTSALKVWLVSDANPSNTIFATSRNYVYDTALVPTDVPYGSKGFIVVRKGGDASVMGDTQATVAGWNGNQSVFQGTVGFKPTDTEGTVSPGDLAAPAPGVLKLP